MTVSIRDVAKHAGVSVGTVSNVLNGKATVSTSITTRVNTAIRELGFVRNAAARQLRAGVSRSIGMIVLDADNPFFSGLARGAERRAIGGGRAVLLGNSAERLDRETLYLDMFEQQRVAGILITPVASSLDRLRELHRRGTPTVLVDRYSNDPEFASVSVDDVAGGHAAIRHLVECGRRRIAFVGGPRTLRQVSDRLRGAREEAGTHEGVSVEVVATTALTTAEGHKAAQRILSKDRSELPDAIFAANDLLAIGILQKVLASGQVTIPEDLALVGYDDIPFASAMAVPLTSIRQPNELMGTTAVELLEAEISQPHRTDRPHVIFEPVLVPRASTASSSRSVGGASV